MLPLKNIGNLDNLKHKHLCWATLTNYSWAYSGSTALAQFWHAFTSQGALYYGIKKDLFSRRRQVQFWAGLHYHGT